MRTSGHCILVFCFMFFDCDALNCRADSGPKGKELKNIYNTCVKQQDENNKSNGRDDHDWETQRYDRRAQDNMARNRGNDDRDYRAGDWASQRGGKRKESRDNVEDQDRMTGQNRNSNSRNRMGYREGNKNDGEYNAREGGRDERQNRNENNNFDRNTGVSSRNDFFQNEDFGVYGNNQYTTQSSRRYKRERRVEMNSGKRSQYNPNPQRFSGYEDKYHEEDNSDENNSTNVDDSKACALHCLLENLHMTGENGMPDRYLVTHVISKDIKDEDLKDFLQESIEECFQILDNENTEDKCEFSKNLLMCLSEKGRANCDDWKDNFQF